MQDDRIEKKPLLDEAGKTIPNAYILRDTQAAEARRKFGLAHRENNHNNYRRTNLEDHVSGGMFIELEQINAQVTAQQLLSSQEIPHSGRVPIVYPPDGGLHVAHGLKRGVDWSSDAKGQIFSSGSKNKLPKEAVDLALKSGVLILCDSVVSSGSTFNELLKQLKPYKKALKNNNVSIIAYSVFAYGGPARPNAGPESYSVRSISELYNRFPDLNLSFYLSDVGQNRYQDGPERGDVMMYTAHPHTEKLWGEVEKRRVPYLQKQHVMPNASEDSKTARALQKESLTGEQVSDVRKGLPGLDASELKQIAAGDDWVLRHLAGKSPTPEGGRGK